MTDREIANKLWEIIAKVDQGQTNYWTGEQLRWLAREIEPPAFYSKDRPINIHQEAA